MNRRIALFLRVAFVCCAVAGAGAFAYYRWRVHQVAAAPAAKDHGGHDHAGHNHEGHDHASAAHPAGEEDEGPHVRLSQQAQHNLGLVTLPLKATTYWRKLELPGILADRPGVSDRGVIAPVTGVVTKIHSHLGETVAPGAPLFVLRLTSESLHTAQRELFQATRELDILRQQRKRLETLTQEGALAQSRIIDIDNQIQRFEVTLLAYRQDLLARGLDQEQIAAAAQGKFVTEITVFAPPAAAMTQSPIALVSAEQGETPLTADFGFEFQELNVALGEQANAGQVLCHLADHRSLLIEGRGFQEDMPLIQQAAHRGLPIELEFDQRPGLIWPDPPRELLIHHVENSIDPETRTFSFHLVLPNQWQTYHRGTHTGLLWRFRPGDRVRLRAAVEKFDNVIVLPHAAVVRDGPEAFVFIQEGGEFHQHSARVLAEDRQNVVLANDESLPAGALVAVNGAASLQRVLRAQLSGGTPGVHVHADGSVHENH